MCEHICPFGEHKWDCTNGIDEELALAKQELEAPPDFWKLIERMNEEAKTTPCGYPKRWLCGTHMRLWNSTRAAATEKEKQWAANYLKEHRDKHLQLRAEGKLAWQ